MDLPAVFGVDRPTLEMDIPKVAHAFEVIVIDGAAKMTKMAVSAIKASDLIVIPVQPSAADLWAVSDLMDMIEARQQLTDGKPKAVFAINRQILGTRLASGVEEVLRSYGVPVLEARTSQRVAYSEAMAVGLTVLDYEPEGKAAEEIKNLYRELKGYLDEQAA